MAASLLLPFATFFTLTRAEAQFAQLPIWVVVDFVNAAPQGGTFGEVAAEDIADELAKTNQYEVTPIETVRRTTDQLSLSRPIPLTRVTNLLRLGQELHAASIVAGEVLNYRIVANGGTKHADVIIRVGVLDAASGLPVNGAALVAHSADRILSVPDDTLIKEAIRAGANAAVMQIKSKSLPHGTLLNTREQDALINQGARTGFENGQRVILTRGREQVATGTVFDVEPDQAYVHVTHQTKGMQPGDRVRVVFTLPEIESKFPRDGTSESPINKPSKVRPPSTGVIQLLLLAGLLGVLFGGNRGSNNSAFNDVISEAGTFVGIDPAPDPASGTPGVRISWTNGPFFRGNQTAQQYQVYRLTPALQVCAIATQALDARHNAVDSSVATDANTNINNWADFSGVVGGNSCTTTALPQGAPPTQPGPLTMGVPQQYAVELIYRMNAIDLPVPTGGPFCFFATQKSIAQGIATPMLGPGLLSPSDQSPITGPITFQFNSPTLPNQLNLDYCVEVSSDSMFVSGKTAVVSTFTSQTSGVQSTSNNGAPQVDLSPSNSRLPLSIRQAQTLFWRAGVRNHSDRPGPVPDAIGQRFLFSTQYFTLTRPLVPPGGAVVKQSSQRGH